MNAFESPTADLALDLAPLHACTDAHGMGFTVVNFNTSAYTLKCIESLALVDTPPAHILVLDNGSAADDFQSLLSGAKPLRHTRLSLYRSEVNLGFARGSNFLVHQLLAEQNCQYIGLLNNDAVAQPVLTDALLAALKANPRLHGIAGGRMHKLREPTTVDTLGITIYGSLMPADRLQTDDLYMGPTGGCCLMTRACAEDVVAQTGYFFDPRFFCYCEDTDLVLRINLLGYQPAYANQLVALHAGQASSGGGKDGFIAYHGWRNIFWMHLKLMPTSILLRHLHWLLLAHAMSVGRYLVSGQFGFVWCVYRDALRQLPEFWAERTALKSRWRIRPYDLEQRIDKSFYRPGYLGKTLLHMVGLGELA